MIVFSLLSIVIVTSMVVCGAHATPSPEESPPGTMIQSCTKPGYVALTFDDGPAERTGDLLDMLAKESIKATFFVLGQGVSDPLFKNYTKRAFDEESMEKTDKAIRDVIGLTPRYMRPPYGEVTPAVMGLLKEMNYEVIEWNVDSNDWQYATEPAKHFIILQHDIEPFSVALVPEIINYIRDKGLNLPQLPKSPHGNDNDNAKAAESNATLLQPSMWLFPAFLITFVFLH
ncbi:hypothetical protein BDF22DRAFT_683389 [Syncephalis plumigaleata]|nr:hypothetical protein BDF22DRAFT_683389 [Syncephalis plumigaleata]